MAELIQDGILIVAAVVVFLFVVHLLSEGLSDD